MSDAFSVSMKMGGVTEFIEVLELGAERAEVEVERLFRVAVELWKGGAIERIPVDEGTAKTHILDEVIVEHENGGITIVGRVGSNMRYAKYIEFGTRRPGRGIAGGAVYRLGLDSNITDAQAIKSWPAKDADAIPGNNEQMPWLRPAWHDVEAWLEQQLMELMESLLE